MLGISVIFNPETLYFQRDRCCSDYPISFHYVNKENMYMLEYWLYHAKVHGYKHSAPPWPKVKTLAEKNNSHKLIRQLLYLLRHQRKPKHRVQSCTRSQGCKLCTHFMVYFLSISLFCNFY